MHRRLILVLLLAVVVLALMVSVTAQIESDKKGNKTAVTLSTSDDYAVLVAVIARYYERSDRPIIIEEFLTPCAISSNFLRDTEKLIEPLRLAKMHNDCFLKPKQGIDVKRFKDKYRFIPIKDGYYEKFFKGKDCTSGWKDFYKTYPRSQGYVRFSRVGFDEEGEFAILEFTYVKGCLEGEAHLFIMRKVNDNWQVANDSILWVF